MRLRIETVENGWVVTNIISDYDEDGSSKSETHVFSHDRLNSLGDEGQEVDAFAYLLSHINSLIGPESNRYSDKRIYVIVRPGDKNEKFTDKDSQVIWGD